MPLLDDILRHETVAIAGLEKNTGKTECINYLIRQLTGSDMQVAITSIGMDGEETDQVTDTDKPAITLPRGFYFATSEKHFRERNLDAAIYNLSHWHTATGRMVTAKVVNDGKIILSGPAQTARMKELITSFRTEHQCNLILIDGALSRTSQASPQVADGIILCVGAAMSANMQQVVRQTAHVCSLIKLEATKKITSEAALSLKRGIWKINKYNEPPQLLNKEGDMDEKQIKREKIATIYISGALTNGLLKNILQTAHSPLEIIVRDFTKIFASMDQIQIVKHGGHKISVLEKNHLIGVCVNPWSPQGYHFEAAKFEAEISKAVQVPVYNIRNL